MDIVRMLLWLNKGLFYKVLMILLENFLVNNWEDNEEILIVLESPKYYSPTLQFPFQILALKTENDLALLPNFFSWIQERPFQTQVLENEVIEGLKKHLFIPVILQWIRKVKILLTHYFLGEMAI